jgi:hypothetical protein
MGRAGLEEPALGGVPAWQAGGMCFNLGGSAWDAPAWKSRRWEGFQRCLSQGRVPGSVNCFVPVIVFLSFRMRSTFLSGLSRGTDW